VSDQAQLQWEARYSRPAAIAAFAAGLLLLAGTFALQTIFEDRPRYEPLPDFLISAHESPDVVILSAALQAASALCLIGVFYYLFRAIVHRTPQLPRWFVYLIVFGPLFYALSQVIGAIDRVDVAHQFAARSSDVGDSCPAIFGSRGDDCAQDLLSNDVSPILVGLSLAGSVATAFLFVMLPLRARRAGLMSQFMAILGVVAGALMVLRLMPLVPEIVQAFWLGALGAMILGIWPGGRGPAWETGRPAPWPSPAQRRGLVPAGGAPEDGGDAGNGSGPPEPEPAPERPSSRKRRRKRR
jgi:hypothetical protein